MDEQERDSIVDFCVYARAEIEGVREEVDWAVYADKLEAMTDEQLRKEADWLQGLLHK